MTTSVRPQRPKFTCGAACFDHCITYRNQFTGNKSYQLHYSQYQETVCARTLILSAPYDGGRFKLYTGGMCHSNRATYERAKAESNRFVYHDRLNGTWKCFLCQQDGLVLDSLASHYETPQHQERHQDLVEDLDLGTEILFRVRFTASYDEKEIAKVTCPRARNAIRVVLYHYFLAPKEKNGNKEAAAFMHKATMMLFYSQICDQLLLLELAV
jgi:hypothetical protein